MWYFRCRMNRIRLNLIFVPISALLHAALIFFLLSTPEPELQKPAPLTTVVFLDEPVVAKAVPATGSPKNAKSIHPQAAKFAPSFRPSAFSHASESDIAVAQIDDIQAKKADDPNADWGSGSKDFSRVEDLGRYDRLYETIDSHVSYPNVLAANQVHGTVNARLVLKSDGHCDWKKTKFDSRDGHLKLYVLSVLRDVCGQDLVRYAHKNASSNLDLSFAFAITEHDDRDFKASQRKVVGNVFLFYRNSQQSRLQWSIGPFKGLFPVPYVALDFGWFQENYDRVIHSKDPLKEFSDHLKIERETYHEPQSS